MAALDQPCDDGGAAEGALHHGIAREPGIKAVFQRGQVEKGGGVGDGVEAPDQGGVVGSHKAQRRKALGFHLFGDEEAEGLLRIAADKAVDHQVFAAVVREAFQEKRLGVGQAGHLALFGQPPGGVGGEVWPAILLEDFKNPVGEEGGGGEFGAVEDGDLGVAAGGFRDLDRHFAQALVADDLAADQEGVAGG